MVAPEWNYATDNNALADYFVESYAGGRPGKKEDDRFGPRRNPIPAGIQIRQGGKRYMAPRELVVANREDYQQAALIGLYRASEKGFDPSRGQPSTRAASYVFDELNKVTRSLRNAKDQSLEGHEAKDSALSAEEEYLGQDPGTNHSYTTVETVGDNPTAPPSAPDAGVTEAGNRFIAAEQNPAGKERPRALDRPAPSARHPKAGATGASFNSVEGALNHALDLLENPEEPTPEHHVAEAAALLRFLLVELAPLLHNDALALAGNIARTEPGLSEEQRKVGDALRKRATRANSQRFDDYKRANDH